MTRTFQLFDKAPVPHLPSTYEVEITVMHGDADAYDVLIARPFDTTELDALSSLVETLDRIKSVGPNQEDTYINIEGFSSWFGWEYARTREEYESNYNSTVPYEDFYLHAILANKGQDYSYRIGEGGWPSDTTNEDSIAIFDKYEVFFYSENLTKYIVKVL